MGTVGLLTREIAYTYRDRAGALPYNGMQDTGERRELRKELQERYGVTELEAINIINGFHIDAYCRKYLVKTLETAGIIPKQEKKKMRRQYRRRKLYENGQEEDNE